MPFVPTTPESKNVPSQVLVSKSLDEWRIHSVKLETSEKAPGTIAGLTATVVYSKGYMESGAYVVVEKRVATCKGAQIEADLNTSADAAKTKFKDLLTQLWTTLQTEGEVPAGTIT